jgi:hypothetical protein
MVLMAKFTEIIIHIETEGGQACAQLGSGTAEKLNISI